MDYERDRTPGSAAESRNRTSRRCLPVPLARWNGILASLGAALLLTSSVSALPLQGDATASDHAHHQHHGHSMTLDSGGMVMNSNDSQLPRDCDNIAADVEFTVAAGARFAADNPGTMFGYSQHEFEVEPCSRVTVTLVNEDEIRHQWMVHGLPRYLYPGGMFHLEAAGGQQKTGTFIVPGEHQTYLVHCDIAQHMEKGMKGQLVVGRGSGDLWSIPGVSNAFNAESYLPGMLKWIIGSVIFTTALLALYLMRKKPLR